MAKKTQGKSTYTATISNPLADLSIPSFEEKRESEIEREFLDSSEFTLRPKDYREFSKGNSPEGSAMAVERNVDPSRASYADFVSNISINPHQRFSSSFDKGYEAAYSKSSGLRDQSPLDRSYNGVIAFKRGGENLIPLFITDVITNFSLSGTTSYSASGSVFYPRNFAQTSILLRCQAPTQLYYGKVIEAIRDSHTPLDEMCRLFVIPKNGDTVAINGVFETIIADGYVTQAIRKHTRHEFSPEFEIPFTVSRFLAPSAWADGEVEYKANSDWHSLITSVRESPIQFEPPPQQLGIANTEKAVSKYSESKNGAKSSKNADSNKKSK